MNVYIIESDGEGYGFTDAAVVVAADPNDARLVMFESGEDNRWFHPTEVTITVIATGPIGERGVILTHETPN